MDLIPFKKKIRLGLEIIEAAAMRRQWPYVVVHRRSLTTLNPKFALPLLCGPAKGRLTCPGNLSIVLVHNYETPPIMEQSLQYTGVDDYTVLRPSATGPWSNTTKLRTLAQALDNGECATEYILYADSCDAVLRSDPALAVGLLDELQCDLIFSNTTFPGGFEAMIDVKQWVDRNDQGPKRHAYINAGVFVGRTAFVRQVLDEAMRYVTPKDLSRREYGVARGKGVLRQILPEFPKGVGSDQVILRYLHPRFFPRMRVDSLGRLALR